MYREDINKLDVVTYLLEFADQQRAAGSPHTGGWADLGNETRWIKTRDAIRNRLPESVIKEFDDERRRLKDFRSGFQGTNC